MYQKLKGNKKGFTLAELLIVVAIVAVLVAIAIPAFTASLEKSRAATWEANARTVHAEAVSAYLNNDAVLEGNVRAYEGSLDGITYTWSYDTANNFATVAPSGEKFNPEIAKKYAPGIFDNGKYTFSVSSGGTLE